MSFNALLLGCVRLGELPGAISAVRRDVALPLSVYPSLGRATPESWVRDLHLTPAGYAQLAEAWRLEGDQSVGGCCGVTPAHIKAVAQRLSNSRSDRRHALRTQ